VSTHEYLNSCIDAAFAKQGRVGRVYNCIAWELGYITKNDHCFKHIRDSIKQVNSKASLIYQLIFLFIQLDQLHEDNNRQRDDVDWQHQ
jgi:hypothetical protein